MQTAICTIGAVHDKVQTRLAATVSVAGVLDELRNGVSHPFADDVRSIVVARNVFLPWEPVIKIFAGSAVNASCCDSVERFPSEFVQGPLRLDCCFSGT